MKSKNIPILLFILVCTAVALLGYSQVWAQCTDPPGENAICLGDGYCSTLENQLNFCIALGPAPANPCYVIEALDCDGQWPCQATIGGVQYDEFRYRATANAPCNCPTWSYSVTQYQVCEGSTSVDYVMDSSPSGASLFRCKVSKCDDINPEAECFFDDANSNGDIICDEDFQNWKLNPTLNCSEGGSIDFSVYTLPGAGVSCGNPTYIRTRDGCQDSINGCTTEPYLGDVLLRGPGCDELSIDITALSMGGFTAIVDPCSGETVSASFQGEQVPAVLGFLCDPEDPTNNPDVPCNPLDDSNCYDNCAQLTNSGNFSGCVVEGTSRFVRGGSVYTGR